MTNKAQLLKKYGSEEAVSEYYRELQKKSRENYKGTGGIHALQKSMSPEAFSELQRKRALQRHAAEKAAKGKDTTKS